MNPIDEVLLLYCGYLYCDIIMWIWFIWQVCWHHLL